MFLRQGVQGYANEWFAKFKFIKLSTLREMRCTSSALWESESLYFGGKFKSTIYDLTHGHQKYGYKLSVQNRFLT